VAGASAQTLALPDGTRLALQVHESTGAARASVVLGCAIGVPQRYYQDFAAWLAGRGFRVTTFDYRGSGASRSGSHRRMCATLDDWTQDYAAVIAHAKAALAQQPLYLIGNSLGGQLPGLLPAPVQAQVDGLLAVAAGSGYWRVLARPAQRGAHLFWYGVLPLATRLCGYFPGARLGLIGNLPAGVAWQWRRWCLHPRYSVGAEGEAAQRSYAAVRFPIHALSFSDDEMMSLRGTEQLLALYTQAPRQIERITPQQLGVARIGHLGFFRADFAATLWPRALQVLVDWCAADAGTGPDAPAPTVARKTHSGIDPLHIARP